MRTSWTEVTQSEGAAALTTGKLATTLQIIPGGILQADAMTESLTERREQIDALVNVLDGENEERVSAELKRTICTVHVPREVQEALSDIIAPLNAQILMRLSPIGKLANPLGPTMIIGLDDAKLMLDAIRMLYAEMYTHDNLDADDERRAAIIIQEQPALTATWRVLRDGTHTIVEGERGLGCWVSLGEPDRFLFTDGAFVRAENGDTQGIQWNKGLDEFTRTPLGGEDAQKLLEFAKPYLEATTQPLLFGTTANGFVCLGAGPAVR